MRGSATRIDMRYAICVKLNSKLYIPCHSRESGNPKTLLPPSLRGVKRRSNPIEHPRDCHAPLRSARNDNGNHFEILSLKIYILLYISIHFSAALSQDKDNASLDPLSFKHLCKDSYRKTDIILLAISSISQKSTFKA